MRIFDGATDKILPSSPILTICDHCEIFSRNFLAGDHHHHHHHQDHDHGHQAHPDIHANDLSLDPGEGLANADQRWPVCHWTSWRSSFMITTIIKVIRLPVSLFVPADTSSTLLCYIALLTGFRNPNIRDHLVGLRHLFPPSPTWPTQGCPSAGRAGETSRSPHHSPDNDRMCVGYNLPKTESSSIRVLSLPTTHLIWRKVICVWN